MNLELKPIGIVHCGIKNTSDAPRHYSVSDVEGVIEVFSEYADGLYRIEERDYIVVLFHFHKPGLKEFSLRQEAATGTGLKGVFNLCSPNRPNPIGLSILKLLRVDGNKLYVKNLDMLDGTPVLDIKPYKPLET